jgi:hypothetical protein
MQEELGIGSRIKHPEFGTGVVINVKPRTYIVVFIERGKIEVAKSYQNIEVIEVAEPMQDPVSMAEIESALIKIIRKFSDVQETVSIGQKWIGGKMIMQPANLGMKPKEIPIEIFFSKIIMLRDRLRVMEQRINAHDKLTEDDKINLQQYLTRIYGSLTTFNILFKDDEDHFVGEKGSKE